MGLLLKIILLALLVLSFSGCEFSKQLLAGDTVVETDDGKKTECVLNLDTCMKECITEHVPGVKVKQSFKVDTDICTLPE